MWSAWSTSRDNWERLMTAVVNREQMLQLFHAQSRSTPSTTTVSSHDRDADDICSQENIRYSEVNLESFSSPTPLVPQNQSVSQVGKDASSRPITRKLFTALYRMVKSKDKDSIDLLAKKGDVKRFSLGELKDATDNFSNRHIMGRGGFGMVYKGELADGTLVAVKRHKHHKQSLGGEAQFRMEVEVRVSTAEHRNLLRLLGFCKTRKERLLVYPYMSNRSAALCLRDRDESELPLSWATRKSIASGVAKGLAYLHEGIRGKKIIHRDIKAANILLDDNFTAVIGDFGLTKIVQHNAAVEDITVTENTLSYEELKAIEGDHLAKVMDSGDSLGSVTTALRGTIGHIAPEYLATGKASVKSDVFGYGIMLLELITGQRAYDLARLANGDDVMLLDWAKGMLEENKLERLADSNMERNYVEREVKKLIQVALLCTQSSPVHRPKMSEVLTLLKGRGLAEKWNEWKNMEVIRQEVLVRDLNVEDSLDDSYTQE